MTEVDLHLHTTCSDGTLSPTDLVRLCGERGLKIIAVTDHDSSEGIIEAQIAADQIDDLMLISGVELSCDVTRAEVHLLGYFVDHKNPDLQNTLLRLREGRENRSRKMVERLNDIGVDISWERVLDLSQGGAIGRPHIAQAMVEAGYVKYPKDAFTDYLGRNGPAYVERVRLDPIEAVQMLVDHGIPSVMAHPTYFMEGSSSDEVKKLKRTLSELKEAGLVGMEVYYGQYTPDQVQMLAKMAKDTGLIPCGGSDYHAAGNPGEPMPGSAGPPIESVEALRSHALHASPASHKPEQE